MSDTSDIRVGDVVSFRMGRSWSTGTAWTRNQSGTITIRTRRGKFVSRRPENCHVYAMSQRLFPYASTLAA